MPIQCFHEVIEQHPILFLQTSPPFGVKVATASATDRNILSSPIMSDNFDACSFSITTGPGFAKRSCEKSQKNY